MNSKKKMKTISGHFVEDYTKHPKEAHGSNVADQALKSFTTNAQGNKGDLADHFVKGYAGKKFKRK